MRHLSRSEFDRFSNFLLNLFTFHEADFSAVHTSANLHRLIHSDDGSETKKGVRTRTAPDNAFRSDSLAHRKSDLFFPSRLMGGPSPHDKSPVIQALKNARNVLRLFQESALLETALEAIGLAAIRLDSNGRILDTDTRATKLLSSYCQRGGGPALPGTMEEWFAVHRSGKCSDNDASGFPQAETLETDCGELTVSLLRGTEDCWLLLQERRIMRTSRNGCEKPA